MISLTDAIIDVNNPGYGADLANVWAQIGNNWDHPSRHGFSMDVYVYTTLIESKQAYFDDTIEMCRYDFIDESERDAYCEERKDELHESLLDTARSIGYEAVIAAELFGDLEAEEAIIKSAEAGLHAAYLLFKSVSKTEVIA